MWHLEPTCWQTAPPINQRLLELDKVLCSPLGHCPPGSMLIGQDVEDLLFQLVGSHMISVFGGADQVVAHLLLFPAVCGVLGTVGLEEGGTSQSRAWIWELYRPCSHRNTSNSACLCTSSALCLFKMNSASLATRTMWSFMAWHRSLTGARGQHNIQAHFVLAVVSFRPINLSSTCVKGKRTVKRSPAGRLSRRFILIKFRIHSAINSYSW